MEPRTLLASASVASLVAGPLDRLAPARAYGQSRIPASGRRPGRHGS